MLFSNKSWIGGKTIIFCNNNIGSWIRVKFITLKWTMQKKLSFSQEKKKQNTKKNISSYVRELKDWHIQQMHIKIQYT